MPAAACPATSASARSPSMNSAAAMQARLARLPVIRLSTTRTWCPRRRSSSARCEPMKPAPPVTRYEATRSPSGWETAVRQAGRQLHGVLVVQLPEHGIRQADAVQLPERVVVAIVVEVLVVGLEHTPIVRILVRLVGVLAEHDPILILHEEVVRGPRLPADVVQHGPGFRGQIRHPGEHRAEARQ